MSHYLALLVIPPGVEPTEEVISKLMAPFDENREVVPVTEDGETYWTNPQGIWDWWQVGGRWTGHYSDYDPALDPKDVETCSLCRGTGVWPDGVDRFGAEWAEANGGCNGCGGKGAAVKWPTDWASCPADTALWSQVRDLVTESPPYAVIGPELLATRERYNPDGRWPDREAGEETDDIPNEERVFVDTSEDVTTALANISDDCTVVVIDYHC